MNSRIHIGLTDDHHAEIDITTTIRLDAAQANQLAEQLLDPNAKPTLEGSVTLEPHNARRLADYLNSIAPLLAHDPPSAAPAATLAAEPAT